MRRSLTFAAVALLFGVAYVLITPPFEVPDEVGHFWRASSIAYGFVANPRPIVPRGFGIIIYALWTPDRTQHMTAERLRLARGVMLEPDVRGPIHPYSFYSPAAYVPQIMAAFVARIARIRPFYAFYMGRFAALMASILIIAIAGEITPAFRDHLHAVSLLPMSLSLFGSWSADAMTIAAALLTSSLIVGGLEGSVRMKRIVGSSLWLALCKPSYALLSLLALLIPNKRWRDVLLLLVAIVGGSALSVWMTMSAAVASPRPDIPVDSHAQLQFMREHPLHFLNIVVNDLRANGVDYVKAMTGRFGLADVAPPAAATVALLVMLGAVGLFNGPSLRPAARAAICAISAAIFFAILTYLYMTSSIAGGTTIEGAHGRYILPLLPLILCVLRTGRLTFSVPYGAIVAIAGAANVVCIAVLIHRYW